MTPGSRKRTGLVAQWFKAWSQITWAQISAVQLVNCVVLGGFFNLSGHQFPYQRNKDNNHHIYYKYQPK